MKPFMVLQCKNDVEKSELIYTLKKYGYTLQDETGYYVYLYRTKTDRIIKCETKCDDICFADYNYIKSDLPNILH